MFAMAVISKPNSNGKYQDEDKNGFKHATKYFTMSKFCFPDGQYNRSKGKLPSDGSC